MTAALLSTPLCCLTDSIWALVKFNKCSEQEVRLWTTVIQKGKKWGGLNEEIKVKMSSRKSNCLIILRLKDKSEHKPALMQKSPISGKYFSDFLLQNS